MTNYFLQGGYNNRSTLHSKTTDIQTIKYAIDKKDSNHKCCMVAVLSSDDMCVRCF